MGTTQGFTWGSTWGNPTIVRGENWAYAEGELAPIDVGLASLGGNRSGSYIGGTMQTSPPINDNWNIQRMSLGVDAVLPSNTVRSMYLGSWQCAQATQVRFGLQGGGDEPVPFTDKDIMWIDHEWHYARYVP